MNNSFMIIQNVLLPDECNSFKLLAAIYSSYPTPLDATQGQFVTITPQAP